MSRLNCDWIPWIDGAPTTEPGWWICSRCGRPRSIVNRDPDWQGSSRACQAQSAATEARPERAKSAGLTQRVKRYRDARAKWKAAGEPMRTAESREALYAICQVCPEFKPLGVLGGQCGVCRCGLHHERDTLNKIAWATEDCPLGKWPAELSQIEHRDHADEDGSAAG